MRWNCFLFASILPLLPVMAWGEEPLMEKGVDTGILPASITQKTDESSSTNDLHEEKRGYIHPFLSASGYYTSNLFRTAREEESDRFALIVPGLWLAFPPRNQKVPEIGTSNTVPGGLSLSRVTAERERPVQGYAIYQANIFKYNRYTKEDRIDHLAQGMFKISTRNGLSLEIVNLFERNSDDYGTGGKTLHTLDTFDANLFNAIVVSHLTPKVQFRLDYGHYRLNYADTSNSYRDRDDDSYSGYLFYQATPKTALFIQAEQIEIDYAEKVSIDSRHNNSYLGIQIQASPSTRGRFKIGYSLQEYGTTKRDDLLAEGRLDYSLNPRVSIYLQGARRVLETDIDKTGGRNLLSHQILSHQALLGYRHKIAAKWQGDANLFFNHNDYDGTVILWDDIRNKYRIASNYYNDEFGGSLTLNFSPSPWMELNLGYAYRERDSNFDSEDYQNQTVFLRATAAL